MTSVFSSLAAGKGQCWEEWKMRMKLLVSFLFMQIEECKLKILEHRQKTPQFQLGMGPDKCSSVKCPGIAFIFYMIEHAGYRILLIFSPPVQENSACTSPLNSNDIQGREKY